MTNDELIARSEAALEGVTKGPWKLSLYQSGTVQVMIREWADGSPNKQHGGSTYGFHSAYMTMHNIGTRDDVETDNEKYRNGKFIAESRDLIPALLAALKASEARGKELMGALSELAEAFDEHVVLPDQNCSCHISPPCGDCEHNSFARYAREAARAALKGGTQ